MIKNLRTWAWTSKGGFPGAALRLVTNPRCLNAETGGMPGFERRGCRFTPVATGERHRAGSPHDNALFRVILNATL